MSHKIGANLGLEPGSFQEAIYDIYVGTVVGAAHIFYFVKRWIIDLVIDPLMWVVGKKNQQSKKHAATDDSGGNSSQPEDKGELKVIGIGFGRTGTVREIDHKLPPFSPWCCCCHVVRNQQLGGASATPVRLN